MQVHRTIFSTTQSTKSEKNEKNEYDYCIGIIPNQPIKQKFYRCDKKFYTETIAPLMKTDCQKYCIIMIQNHDTKIYHIEKVSNEKTNIQCNHHLIHTIKGGDNHKQTRGGYSQNRYQRLYEISVHEYAKKVAEYIDQSCRNYKHILLVGSCSLKKQKILDLLSLTVKEKITSITRDEQTPITDLIPLLKDSLYEDMEKDISMFFSYVNNPFKESLVVYGEKETFKLWQQNLLECVFYCPSKAQYYDWINEMDHASRNNIRVWKLDVCSLLSEQSTVLVNQWGGFAGICRYSMIPQTI